MEARFMAKRKQISRALISRLKKIRFLLLDVDGVLTDGRVLWIPGRGFTRFYHVYDGYGIRMLLDAGFGVGLLTAADTDDIRERAKHLGIETLMAASRDKGADFDRFLVEKGLTAQEVAYMGDELFDLPVLERSGFSASVPEAPDEVKRKVHYVTRRSGGNGAVREIIDLIRVIHGIGPKHIAQKDQARRQ